MSLLLHISHYVVLLSEVVPFKLSFHFFLYFNVTPWFFSGWENVGGTGPPTSFLFLLRRILPRPNSHRILFSVLYYTSSENLGFNSYASQRYNHLTTSGRSKYLSVLFPTFPLLDIPHISYLFYYLLVLLISKNTVVIICLVSRISLTETTWVSVTNHNRPTQIKVPFLYIPSK